MIVFRCVPVKEKFIEDVMMHAQYEIQKLLLVILVAIIIGNFNFNSSGVVNNLPHIPADRIILGSPRLSLIYSVPIHFQPVSHLSETLLEYR